MRPLGKIPVNDCPSCEGKGKRKESNAWVTCTKCRGTGAIGWEFRKKSDHVNSKESQMIRFGSLCEVSIPSWSGSTHGNKPVSKKPSCEKNHALAYLHGWKECPYCGKKVQKNETL